MLLRHTCRYFVARQLATNANANISVRSSGAISAREILRRRMIHQKDEMVRRDKRKDPEESLLEGVESIAAVRMLKSNPSKFESYARKLEASAREEAEAERSTAAASTSGASTQFPLRAEARENLIVTTALPPPPPPQQQQQEDDSPERIIIADRGFFVRGDRFCDDYQAATAMELPEEEMNDSPFVYYGLNEETVETIPFQLPGQETISTKVKRVKDDLETGEWLSNYGSESNEAIAPSSTAKCTGCGAHFHCNNTSLPGFVPVQLFTEIEKNAKRRPVNQRTDYLCRRCYLYKQYNFLLNVNTCEVDYRAVMGHLKLIQEALIILIVDMTELQGSIHLKLPEIIGEGKPMIVVGNKVDLLPPDAQRGYLKRFHDSLRTAIKDSGFADRFNVLKYALISAKTGFGVEDLITNIYSRWMNPKGTLRSNIYMVGCTNAGKSTLFNAFLQSDLCAVRAIDLVERVTTSIWPGTTLSLLKFPLMSPTPRRLEQRRKRLLVEYKWAKLEKTRSQRIMEETNDPRYITLQGNISNTFKATLDEEKPVSVEKTQEEFMKLSSTIDIISEESIEEHQRKDRLKINSELFKNSKYCFDTPGTVNREQCLGLFTLDELIKVIPRKLIIPRTFLLHPGDTILIAGVGRIDLLSSERGQHDGDTAPVYMSYFGSDLLNVTTMKTDEVDEYVKKYLGTSVIDVPMGDANRLSQFPELASERFEIQSEVLSNYEGSTDVLLSSIGWVTLTSISSRIKIKAWTPDGRGIGLRSPPLLPHVAALRGSRIGSSSAYTTQMSTKIETSIYWRGEQSNKYSVKDGKRDYIAEKMGGVSFDLM